MRHIGAPELLFQNKFSKFFHNLNLEYSNNILDIKKMFIYKIIHQLEYSKNCHFRHF